MAESEHPFTLYDGHILMLLQGHTKLLPSRSRTRRTRSTMIPRAFSGGLVAFEGLQHPELMEALINGNTSTAARLLKKLPVPLPPKDAAAACLCALAGKASFMHTLLNRCPPIREFQFLGVGKVSSLLAVAARFDKHEMLDLLLKRGADPNADPANSISLSPLETAFCNNNYVSLQRLIKEPDLQVTLTQPILNHWATLRVQEDDAYHTFLWCCQQLLESVTGQPVSPHEPLPIPQQLGLDTVLSHNNLALAAHICSIRPLTEADKSAAVIYLRDNVQPDLLNALSYDFHLEQHRMTALFLLSLLKNSPDLLHIPEVRTALASTALVPVKPDAALQHWVEQLPDGPVLLTQLPESGYGRRFSGRSETFDLTDDFFPRWDQRLGERFSLTMPIQVKLRLKNLSDDEIRLLLKRVTFIGERRTEEVCSLSMELMLFAPPDMIPGLMQSGGLLSLEHPNILLTVCEELPPDRRNLLLPYLHKEVDYNL